MIRLTFHGGVQTVTGSRHLVELNGHKVLLDCGLYQGRRNETYERNLNFPFDPASVDAMILSHVHMDHSGNIPNLVKRGFNGDIHCTPGTADLANIMLHDSARIQEKDTEYVNKVRARQNQPPVKPLYNTGDVEPALNLFVTHQYDRPFSVTNGISALLRDAGHIMGSAITVLRLDDNGRRLSICYAVDLGKKNSPIVRDPAFVTDADVLIIESTYGERERGDIRGAGDKLAQIINETVAKGGKIIVPSFAIERTQDLVYILHQLKLQNKIPDIPVYVDSPLATNATEIFRMHPEYFDAETREMLLETSDPFGFSKLQYVRSVDESKRLNDAKKPIMIISSSGMAESGRILHHLKNNIGNPLNTLLIVGWQAPDTLGRKLAEKWDVVRIFGEEYQRKCRVEVFDEFSAHADRRELIEWVSKGKGRWQRVFVVHGEPESLQALAKGLTDTGLPNVAIPDMGQTFEL